MEKFLRGFISIEKSLQILGLVGVIFFLGYLGLNAVQRDRLPSSTSPTTQLK